MKKIKKGDSCWEWQSKSVVNGYGRLLVNGKHILAHRFSYLINNSEIPVDKCVLHSCDNRKCVNPDHLFLGSYKDNRIDCIKKKRNFNASGENNGRAKLTKQIVKYIKKSNKSASILAAEFGVHRTQVYRVLSGKSWA